MYKLTLILVLILVSCTSIENTDIPAPESRDSYDGEKILYIDSYHEGYSWSDGITRGVTSTLDNKGIDLKIHRLDTKRNTDEAFKMNAAVKARQIIDEFNPDVVIVSDDNAFKYLVMKYYKDAALPFTYCGLNWDSSVYGAPYSNTAGMIEISLTQQVIEKLKSYTDGNQVGYISADSYTEQKVMENYEKLGIVFDKIYWPKNLEEFKRDFIILQDEVDVIFLENTVGLEGWNDEQDVELTSFIQEIIKVPVGGINDWVENLCMLQIQKLAEEQGEYAANTALRILDGENPSDISEVKNKKGKLVLNLMIAEKLGITFTPEMIKNAEEIIE